MSHVPARRFLSMTLALIGVVLIAACGDDDAGESAAKPKVERQTLAIEVTEQTADKFAMTAPESVEAGIVEISMKAPAGKESHDAQLVRVEGDHSLEEC